MTVAALIVPGAPEAGTPTIAELRRIAECAWAGGAWPIRFCRGSAPADALAAVAAGTTADLAPAAHRTIAAATSGLVRAVGATTAVLFWPADHPWVDPESVTLLLQAHGGDPGAVLRAADGDPGYPLLLPVPVARSAAEPARASAMAGLLARLAVSGAGLVLVPTGDAGTTHDRRHPADALPPYRGPDRPLAPPPEWGAAAADAPDDPAPAGRRGIRAVGRSRRTR